MDLLKRYKTVEAIQAECEDASKYYWRLHDPLCRRLIHSHFADTSRRCFSATFFPFFREASLLGVTRCEPFNFSWLAAGFLAGLNFGLANGKSSWDMHFRF